MQVKTVMNPSRMRILEYFIMHGSGTAAELQTELCDIPTASLYRHLNVLLDDGWIELAAERRVRGATERRYRIVSTTVNENGAPPFTEVLLSLIATFEAYFASDTADPVRDMLSISTATLMLSDEEFTEYLTEQAAFRKKYFGKPPDGQRKPRRLTYISSPCEEEES